PHHDESRRRQGIPLLQSEKRHALAVKIIPRFGATHKITLVGIGPPGRRIGRSCSICLSRMPRASMVIWAPPPNLSKSAHSVKIKEGEPIGSWIGPRGKADCYVGGITPRGGRSGVTVCLSVGAKCTVRCAALRQSFRRCLQCSTEGMATI